MMLGSNMNEVDKNVVRWRQSLMGETRNFALTVEDTKSQFVKSMTRNAKIDSCHDSVKVNGFHYLETSTVKCNNSQ